MENNDKNTENDTTAKTLLCKVKNEVAGTYTKEPKCKICNTLTHEWLDGDYTSLICDSSICLIR
jgi:hypothetical protein